MDGTFLRNKVFIKHFIASSESAMFYTVRSIEIFHNVAFM